MIIKTIDTASQLRDQFARYNRQDQFSYEAVGLLFDFLNDMGTDYELDIIGLCCEFAEMDADEVRDSYSLDEDADIADYLQDRTTYLGETSSGYVFVQF